MGGAKKSLIFVLRRMSYCQANIQIKQIRKRNSPFIQVRNVDMLHREMQLLFRNSLTTVSLPLGSVTALLVKHLSAWDKFTRLCFNSPSGRNVIDLSKPPKHSSLFPLSGEQLRQTVKQGEELLAGIQVNSYLLILILNYLIKLLT